MSGDISIMIADDHPIFRQGLKQIIEHEPARKPRADEIRSRASF